MKTLLSAAVIAVAILFTGFNPPEPTEHATRQLKPRPAPPVTIEMRNCHAYGERHGLHTIWDVQTGKCAAIFRTDNGYDLKPVAVE